MNDKSSFVKDPLAITMQLVITKQLKLQYTITILQEYQLGTAAWHSLYLTITSPLHYVAALL
jgi:hypothetical protein